MSKFYYILALNYVDLLLSYVYEPNLINFVHFTLQHYGVLASSGTSHTLVCFEYILTQDH